MKWQIIISWSDQMPHIHPDNVHSLHLLSVNKMSHIRWLYGFTFTWRVTVVEICTIAVPWLCWSEWNRILVTVIGNTCVYPTEYRNGFHEKYLFGPCFSLHRGTLMSVTHDTQTLARIFHFITPEIRCSCTFEAWLVFVLNVYVWTQQTLWLYSCSLLNCALVNRFRFCKY